MKGDPFVVPAYREVATVADGEWETPESAAHRLGLSAARLRLLANADIVRVAVNEDGQQGLLRRSVDHEVERRSNSTLLRRVRFLLGDVFWTNVPDKWRSRPWDDG